MVSSDPIPPPLHGVRILSFGSFVAGNIGALLLAELGADVVKIEARDRPEALRSYDSPDQAEVFEPSGIRTTALYAGMTRSLRSACIDMKSDAGRDTFRQLAAQADVVFENLGPGQMEAWGCSFAALQGQNPRLVMVSISGYGRTGPLAGFRAYASNINNFLGLTSTWAPDGIHFDFVAALHGVNAVVAGLASVDRGAPGMFVDLAQTEAGAATMAPLYLDFLANQREWATSANEVPGALFSCVVKCRGADEWLALELEDVLDWNALCRYLEREDLARRDGPVTPPDRAALHEVLEEWTTELTPFQAAVRLQAIGLAAGPVQNSEDVWRDAQLRSRRSWVEVRHPDIGPLDYPAAPFRLSMTPGRVKSPGPRLGEHTELVLVEWLGLGRPAIADLGAAGAVWQPTEGEGSAPE